MNIRGTLSNIFPTRDGKYLSMAVEEILSNNEQAARGDELVYFEMDDREIYVITDDL